MSMHDKAIAQAKRKTPVKRSSNVWSVKKPRRDRGIVYDRDLIAVLAGDLFPTECPKSRPIVIK